MKFTITNDKMHEFDLKITFSKEEKKDRLGCIYDVALGCSRVILEMVRACDSKKNAKTLAQFMLEKITESVDTCIEDHFNEKESSILEHSLYEFMENAFYDWLKKLNKAHRIFNEEDLIKVCQNKEATLKYLLKETDVSIFISLNNGQELEIFCFPISLIDESKSRFDAYCTAAKCIATVAFDKIYGQFQNPLRKEDLDLIERIKNEIKIKR